MNTYCSMCHSKLEGKQTKKFCSERCKVKAFRNKRKTALEYFHSILENRNYLLNNPNPNFPEDWAEQIAYLLSVSNDATKEPSGIYRFTGDDPKVWAKEVKFVHVHDPGV